MWRANASAVPGGFLPFLGIPDRKHGSGLPQAYQHKALALLLPHALHKRLTASQGHREPQWLRTDGPSRSTYLPLLHISTMYTGTLIRFRVVTVAAHRRPQQLATPQGAPFVWPKKGHIQGAATKGRLLTAT